MSKVLYPKPNPSAKLQIASLKEDPTRRPYHVEYTSTEDESLNDWGFYSSELAVKLAAWYRCRLLGFTPNATLYSRDERKL